jgi:branched-subunit amino acid ABC-type transport system permease component
MPPRSRAFVTAISAGLCGLVGLLLGGYGVDLVRLQRPDFEYGTLLAAAIVGGLGWCAGAVVAWRLASARPAASRADVVLLVLGAAVVLWFRDPDHAIAPVRGEPGPDDR